MNTPSVDGSNGHNLNNRKNGTMHLEYKLLPLQLINSWETEHSQCGLAKVTESSIFPHTHTTIWKEREMLIYSRISPTKIDTLNGSLFTSDTQSLKERPLLTLNGLIQRTHKNMRK
jgi:hypothetical protein